jgi:diamine N-acetyltransferase
MAVALRAITDENRGEVVALRVTPSQTRFVGTVADALADAKRSPKATPGIERSTPRAGRSGS